MFKVDPLTLALNKAESKVMSAILVECKEKNTALITPDDLLKSVADKKISKQKLDEIVCALNTDGYFDLIYSDRHGESMYCIALTEKGKGYRRSKSTIKRTLLFRLAVSGVLAVFSFLIGVILKAIFT